MLTKIPHSLSRLVLSVAAMSVLSFGPAKAEDYPTRDIQFVVPFSAGGGSDVLARNIAGAIKELKLLPVNILIDNRPGSGGAVGYNFLAGRKGNPDYVGTVSIAFFTTPLMGGSPVSYKNFQPLAAIARDPYIMAVAANSPFKTMKDLAAKGTFIAGSPAAVSDSTLLARRLAANMKAKVQVVPFDGDGEALSALLGGHVDVMFGNLSEIIAQVKGGSIRAIGITTEDRIAALPDVPTFKELGYDIQLAQLRGMVMPLGTPPETVAYWEALLKKLAESDYWREHYLERFSVLPAYLDSKAFGAEIVKINDRYEILMRELGVIK